MSHFTCLVIGPDHEKQLAPFHEFECTGEDNEFVQDIDITENLRADYAEHGEGEPFVEFIEGRDRKKPLLEGQLPTKDHKYGYVQLDAAGEVVRVIERTNPNAHWDWYSEGGRWAGFFQLKLNKPEFAPLGVYAEGRVGEPSWMNRGEEIPQGRADQALLQDIDFATMRDEAGNRAGALWDAVALVVEGTEVNQSWVEVREAHEANMDAAREAYHAQPRVAAFKADKELDEKVGFFGSVDEFNVPREQYVQSARDKAGVTFAVVKDGKWYQKGSMGWRGCVSGEKDTETWNSMFQQLIDGLPGDTQLTLVDCHI